MMIRILLVVLGLAVTLGAGPAAAAEPERPVLDWLAYDPSTLADYAVDTDVGDPARHVAIPVGGSAGAKRVMILIPSRSVAAYTLAVNTVLQVFARREVPARFDIWYYDGDTDVALEALDWSYRQPVDLIMSAGSSATSFLRAHHSGHAIPAVTSASKDPIASGHLGDPAGSGTNIAYTSINVETGTLVAYLRRLIPDLATIAVAYSAANSSAVLTQVNPLKAAAEELGLEIVDVTVTGRETAEADLEAALPRAIAMMRARDPELERSILLVTGSTAVYERIDQINRHAGTLPVVSMLPDVVRAGPDSALLSIGVNLTSALTLAGVYAVDVVTGAADPGALPVGTVSPPDLAINFLVAERIGVKIPFSFLESSTFVYDTDGRQVVAFGQRVY
ncbi:ABC transporter substrate binding protein [Thalassobaculum sp.]|uniref:ABC transporter substrate binding protein n=1 Tax=Thalassobaculum sp. TaxID=2022740 RepID=UPI0032EFDA62